MKAWYLGVAVTAALCIAFASAVQSQDAPRFRTGVDLLPIDVTVVDGQGRPVLDLATGDFSVFVDGTPRKVVSAEWIPLTGLRQVPAETAPEGYTSNAQAANGRLIVLAIDQPNIRVGGVRAIVAALDQFIDRLSASDRLTLVAFGRGTPAVPFTADRERVKQAIARITGQMAAPPLPIFRMSLPAASLLLRGDQGVRQTMMMDCPFSGPNRTDECETVMVRDANNLLQLATEQRDDSIRSLTGVLNALKGIDAPKSLLLVSEGLPLLSDETDMAARFAALGALAATARTSIYALRLDDRVFDSANATSPNLPEGDTQLRATGLERITNAARGAMFTVTGTGEAVVARIESELSGYYLLGVAPLSSDSGKPLAVRVEVTRKGVTVRTRPRITPVSETDQNQSPQAAVAAALASPIALTALPLRVITMNFQGPDLSKVQLLIHADVGQGYTAAQSVAAAYIITDDMGRVVEGQSISGRLTPPVAGMALPLPFVAGAALPPGDYMLKLAVAQGSKVGTVEHRIHALLLDVGALKLSDLTVGGPMPTASAPSRPTVDDEVRFGVVHGYLEAYGSGAGVAQVRYEVAADDQSPAILAADVPRRIVSESRALFSALVPTAVLPPGRYRLRAVVTPSTGPATIVSRSFEVAERVVRSAGLSAPGGAQPDFRVTSTTELFLPIDADDRVVQFDIVDALRAETLEPFNARVPAATQAAFQQGIEALRIRDYAEAERSLKGAIRPGVDVTAAFAYLAAAYAASGHDLEAASAWQTALVKGSDMPQIFLWLGGALLRIRELPHAQNILEEGTNRWPADNRFARPLALVYAETGKGYAAMEQLRKHLALVDDDLDALYLGVEWIYQVHVGGSAFEDQVADLQLARTYADRYERAKGPRQPLVKRWIEYLTRTAQR